MTTAPDSKLATLWRPAPNREARVGGCAPDMLILHYTGMESCEAALDWLTCVESRVSCHYLVDDEGRITQMVPEAERAWHAGQSFWAGVTDLNSCSIGIEIHNPGHAGGYPDFTGAQMSAVAALADDICQRWSIAPERVLAHSDVAPARKIDPGEKFDWGALAAVGVGHWVPPAPVDCGDPGMQLGDAGPLIAEVQRLLAAYGYAVEAHGELDEKTAFVVTAFQRHFRPARVDGYIDQSTITTLERLLAKLSAMRTASAAAARRGS